MKGLRTYFIWTMLFAALTFAVPRHWLHNCTGTHAPHENASSDGNHDEIDHGECAACIFSLTSTVSSSEDIVLIPPHFVANKCIEIEELNVLLEIQITSLRGPPMA